MALWAYLFLDAVMAIKYTLSNNQLAYKKRAESKINHMSRLQHVIETYSNEKNFLVICRALFHQEQEIAVGAALALGHVKDARALPYLLRAVLSTDARRVEAVVWALGEVGDESAVPFLLMALEANFVPKSTLLALGKIGSLGAVFPVISCLKDPDEIVRLLAVKALSHNRLREDVESVHLIRQAISDCLMVELSRRVRLMLSVLKNVLDKAVG